MSKKEGLGALRLFQAPDNLPQVQNLREVPYYAFAKR